MPAFWATSKRTVHQLSFRSTIWCQSFKYLALVLWIGDVTSPELLSIRVRVNIFYHILLQHTLGSLILRADCWSAETLLCNSSHTRDVSDKRGSCCPMHYAKRKSPACSCFQQRSQQLQYRREGVVFSIALQTDSPST